MPTGVFWILAVMTLIAAVWVVTLQNLFRAAFSLGVVLLGIAGLFIVLEAEFLAFVQILVYVGAILTLIMFAIMLTAPHPAEAPPSRQRQVVPAALASLALFVVLVRATAPLLWPATPAAEAISLAELGQQLVTTLALPFEVVSLLFVAAVVGAIALAATTPLRPPST